MKNQNSRKLKFFLISIIIISLGIIIAVFFKYRNMLDETAGLKSAIQNAAKMSLGKVHHTATREGVIEWSIDASSARLLDEKKQLILDDLSVIFYMKDGKEVHLTAEKGFLFTDSNDIEVAGNVMVRNNNYVLKTEKLNYEHTRRILFSNGTVEISSNSEKLTADSFFFDLNTKKTMLEGNVKGTFSENVNL
ncbi:MAG: LPS export ABC transporter periplasmic protein LptC [Desulfobacteraceae bacterium]|nr:LPS export ABC transporter periplasmic protein LptC [Desulfobacteraceae bacterium]MBC2718099.1 LPS export ABC transporter periplasmic protein LptC [Desulfobacteraceae bacterium]